MKHVGKFINTDMTEFMKYIEVKKITKALTELDDIILGTSQALKSVKLQVI